jgi:transcription initiation factor TFIIIB Brf1 subunit/transcription initiation factor TFIIB
MTDFDTGEVFCSKCGYVEKERDNDVSPRVTALSERTIPKSQYHKHNREGSSKGFYKVDSEGRTLSKQNKHYFDRISNEKNYWKTKPENYSDIKRNKCFNEIEYILSKSSISTDDPRFDEACTLYDKFSKNKICYRKNNTILAVACVYLACKNYNHHITIKKISRDINQNSETIKEKVKNIEKACRTNHIKIENTSMDKIRLIQLEILKFPKIIVSEKLKRKKILKFDYKKIEHIISSSKKESIASGIIDIISRENEVNVTPKKIAEVYNISEYSVRSLSKKIQKALEE